MRNKKNKKQLLIDRKRRLRRFKKEWLPLLRANYFVKFNKSQSFFLIKTQKFGCLDFYPMANKVMIHNGNKWIPNGLNWLSNNLTLNNQC